jgi:hypothetical protein
VREWQRNLNYAAAGVVGAALVELTTGRGHSRPQTLARLVAGGLVAAAYANLVPRESWGPRSAAAFARLPLVHALGAGLAQAGDLELAASAGLAGMALRLIR